MKYMLNNIQIADEKSIRATVTNEWIRLKWNGMDGRFD